MTRVSPSSCVECGKPGEARYAGFSKCYCPLHQTVSDIVNQVAEEALRVIPSADWEALSIARTRLLRARTSTVKLKAIGVRMRKLEREAR